MDVIPGAHANVLIYLLSFIRQIFEWPVLLENPEAKRRIGSPPLARTCVERVLTIQYEHLRKR